MPHLGSFCRVWSPPEPPLHQQPRRRKERARGRGVKGGGGETSGGGSVGSCSRLVICGSFSRKMELLFCRSNDVFIQ
jgi:hypothetical protein